MLLNFRNLKFWYIALLSLYTSFSLLGGIFFFPADHFFTTSALSVTIYIILAIVLFVFFNFIMKYLYKRKMNNRVDSVTKEECWKFYWQSFALILGIGLLYWVMCYPANMSQDSIGAYEDPAVKPFSQLTLYQMFVKILIAVWHSPAIVSLAQVIIFSFIYSLWMVFFYKHGLNKKLILISMGLFYAAPSNALHIVVIWTTTLYLLLLLTTLYCFVKIFYNEWNSKPLLLILLGVLLGVLPSVRSEASAIYFVGIFLLFCYALINKQWKVFYIPLLCALFISNIIPQYNERYFTHRHINGLIFMPINTAYLYGVEEELPPKVLELARSVKDESMWRKGWKRFNGFYWIQDPQGYADIDKLARSFTISSFLEYYWSLWVESPIVHLRTKLDYAPIWNPYYTPGLTNVFLWEQPSSYNNGKAFPSLEMVLNTTSKITANILSIWLSTIVCLFLIGYFYFYDDRKKLIIFFPFIITTIILFLTTPSADFRYFHINIFTALLASLLACIKIVLPSKNLKPLENNYEQESK